MHVHDMKAYGWAELQLRAAICGKWSPSYCSWFSLWTPWIWGLQSRMILKCMLKKWSMRIWT